MPMLKTFWKHWQFVARKIGTFQSRIILTLFYFVVIGPFALAVRLFSDPLCLRRDPSWHRLSQDDQSAPSLSSARQQF